MYNSTKGFFAFLTVLMLLGPFQAFAKSKLSVQTVDKQEKSIPYYTRSKSGKILVHEEGEEALFARKGLVPIGSSIAKLDIVSAKAASEWADFICTTFKVSKDVFFPSGSWKTSYIIPY